ncbi:MAG: hypothetical protein J6Z12_01910 [Paludibacteraceae bacterium]|nr:hypothetical protein [Paludibacteraceae bacterium]
MQRPCYILCALLAALLLLPACSKKKKENIKDYTNPHLKGFYLSSSNRAEGIEKTYFVVDTLQGMVYNEDSIDYHADLTRIIPIPTYYERVYSIAFDDEAWNEKDSLDFTRIHKITLVAGNRKRQATYQLDVRQHKVDPDSAAWHLRSSIAPGFTPTAFGLLTDGNTLYHLAANGHAGGCVSTSSDGTVWTNVLTYSEDIEVISAQLTGGGITALSSDGSTSYRLELNNPAGGWTSATPTPVTLTALVGFIADTVYATDGSAIYRFESGNWSEATLSEPLPTPFPARGAACASFKNRIFLYGGTDAAGNALSTAYSTMNDGRYWTSVMNRHTGRYEFGVRTGSTAVYYLKRVYLIGGNAEDSGLPTRQVYVSRDEGFSWDKATGNLYLPAAYAARSGCAATVFKQSIWIAGGTLSDGSTTTDVWEGRLNRADFIIQ